jgi:hypothetical protein
MILSDNLPFDRNNPGSDHLGSMRLLSGLSCVSISPDHINAKGWVVGPEGLIFWVPEDCRYGLTHTPIMTLGNMRRDRRVRIDFTDFRYGASWADIYERLADEENTDVVPSRGIP